MREVGGFWQLWRVIVDGCSRCALIADKDVRAPSRVAAVAGPALSLAFMLCGWSACAQTPAPTAQGAPVEKQADELKTQEQILDELKLRRAQVAALQIQVAALTEQVKTMSELAATHRERGDLLKEAATTEAAAGLLAAERDSVRREQLEEYRAELERLRSENDRLRRSRNVRTILGFGIGASVGAIVSRR